MARQVPSQKKTSRVWLGCGIAIIVVLLFGLVAVISLFLLYSHDWHKEPSLNITITRPESGIQVEVKSPVELQATGSNSGGLTRLELYADGALISAQESSDAKGENPLILASIWTPLTAGRHALVARGYSSDDKFADSQVIYVIAADAVARTLDVDAIPKKQGSANPSLADIAAAYGVSADDFVRHNPSLSGTDPTAPLPPGTTLSPPPSPGGTSNGSPPTSSSPPTPPRTGNPAPPTALRANADCAHATLNWTDSPDETSYRIYRYSGGSSTVVGTAAANATSFRDSLPAIAGAQTYLYQVASVRSGREGLSLMASAVTPATCTGPGALSGTDLMLKVAMVDTDDTWEGIYCYLSVNSRPYERIPVGDSTSISPESGNIRYYNLTRLPGGGRYDMTGHPAGIPVTLNGNCRGRRGPLTYHLGNFAISHPQADWNGTLRHASGGSYRFSYCLGPASQPCAPVIPGVTTIYLDIPVLTDLLFYLPSPTNLRMDNSLIACNSLTNPSDRWACRFSSPRCSIFGICEGSRTLFWDWVGTAFVPETSLTGYTVVRTTTNRTTGSHMSIIWDINRQADGTLPKYSWGQETDLLCGTHVDYRVRARQGSRFSNLSDPFSFNTPACTSTSARVEVTFQTIQISHVNDRGEACLFCPERDEQLESQGSISAGGSLIPFSTRTFTSNLVARSYDWSSFYLRNLPGGSAALNNNVFRFVITDPARDTIAYSAQISDLDRYTLMGDTNLTEFCNVSGRIPPHTMAEWANFNQTFTLSDNRNPESDCVITVNVRGYPTR